MAGGRRYRAGLSRAALAATCCAACAWAAPARAELRAERITEANAAELRIGGPDAIGGVGDWYLANDVVEAIVDDPSRRHGKLDHGGTLVDVGLRDRRGEDQFARLIPLVNLSQRVFVGYDAIRAEVDEHEARLVVTSPGLDALPRGGVLARALDPMVPDPASLRGVTVTTEYAVRPGEPFVRITTTLRNQGSEVAPVFAWSDLWMRGGRSMRAFVGNARTPAQSRGFHHRSFSRDSLLASADAMEAFSHVVAAGLPGWPPIAYALLSPERTARGLSFFGVTGQHVSLATAFVSDPTWEAFGLVRFVSALRGGLAPGASWTDERRLLVVGGADVASATDAIFPLLGVADGHSGVEGRVEPAGLRCAVHVDDAAGHPVTQALAGADGRFRAVLPPGRYRLRLRAEHQPPRELAATVEAGAFAAVPVQRFAPPGWLVLSPAFADGGPGRVVVLGREGTPDPVFGAELLDFRIDGQRAPSATRTRDLYFAGNASDPGAFALPPGRYRLVATRGPEWGVAVADVDVPGPGTRVRVPPFELARTASLPGYASADLHVHSQASDDSQVSNAARMRHFLAAGVDVLVATDHDHVPDYGPALAALGVGGRIHVVRGVEVTSSAPEPGAPWTIGHHNTWPMRLRPSAHRQGAPPSQDLSVGELYSLLRRDYGAQVVQLNHARGKTPGLHEDALLTHLTASGEPFDPRRPLGAEPNRALLEAAPDGTRAVDFDALEVMNGSSWEQYRGLREDWYALLRQGLRRTATANSDTHGPDELAGFPRNYVWLGEGARWNLPAFDAALREGRSFGTTGPLIRRFEVDGARMGDLVAASGGRVHVAFEVDAAPWVPVDEVRLLADGEVVRVFHERSGTAELRLAHDAFVTLEAGAPLDAVPEIWRARHRGLYTDVVAPGFLPLAFANPIYVDVDGDGRFRPPGLPPAPLRWTGGGPALAALGLGIAALWWRRRR